MFYGYLPLCHSGYSKSVVQGDLIRLITLLVHKGHSWAFLVAPRVKNPPAMQETWVWSLGWEDPLEKGMATHSSILAWRIPWIQEPDGLQSMESQRVGHDWATNTVLIHVIFFYFSVIILLEVFPLTPNNPEDIKVSLWDIVSQRKGL